MPRTKSDSKVATLEKQRLALEAQIREAKNQAAKRRKEEDARRKALLGAAVMSHFQGQDLAELIRVVIPRHVKARDDLALFEEWLNTDAIELPQQKADATEPG